MKLHKIKTILAVAAMGVLSQSCLDLDPKDQLAESNLWSSPSDFQLFANQFYGWTRDFGSLDNNSVKPLHSDYNSDLLQAVTTVTVSATALIRYRSPMAITVRAMHISGVPTCCCRMWRNIPLLRTLHSM